MKRLSLPNYIRRSGAKFESTERFLRNSVVVDSTDETLSATGIPLTHLGENRFATSKDELHAFIIGDSGCGKTRRLILPSIRLYAKNRRSMVISDPKGELYRNTGVYLQRQGYNVRVLNFRTPSRGSRWNPLSLIESLYRSGDQDNQDRAVLMLKDIIDIMKKECESTKDRYWENAAAKVLLGVALLIMEYGEPGDLTFENISLVSHEMFEILAGKKQDSNSNSHSSNSKPKTAEDFRNFLSSLPKGSPIVENLHGVANITGGTLTSVLGVYDNMISVYTNQTSLLDLFSSSDIDVAELGRTPTALFFILPDDSSALYPIATVFVKQIYSTLVGIADSNLSGVLDNKVAFLLDEFANFTEIPDVESMLTAARSRGITFVLVCQSMEQLIQKYGEARAEILLSNCRLWIYMSCRNLGFLERLERLIGHYISPYTGEKIPLIDMGELQHFEMGQVLVLNDRCRPVMGFLPDYSAYNFGDSGDFVRTDLPSKRSYDPRQPVTITKLMVKALSVKQTVAPQTSAAQSVPTYAPSNPDAASLRDQIRERIEKRKRDAITNPPTDAPTESGDDE